MNFSQRYLTSDRKEIVKMSANSVKVILQGKEKEYPLPSNAKINDGKWHFIGKEPRFLKNSN